MDDLSDDWFDCSVTGDAQRFEDELRREMAASHDLARDEVVCVVWRKHEKETVFWLPGRRCWAVVHLTWNVEADGRWPSAELRETWKEVVAEVRDRGRP